MPDGRIYKVIGNDKSGAYGVTAEARKVDLWIEQQERDGSANRRLSNGDER